MLLTCEVAVCAIGAFVCSDEGSSLQFAVVASGTDVTKGLARGNGRLMETWASCVLLEGGCIVYILSIHGLPFLCQYRSCV